MKSDAKGRQRDLFGGIIEPERKRVYIFADERKRVKDHWNYMGILAAYIFLRLLRFK